MSIKTMIDCKVSPEGKVEVKCIFHTPNNLQFERWLPVENPKFHWETIYDLRTRKPIGDKLVLDNGLVKLPNRKLTFLAYGIPPLHFQLGSVYPITLTEPEQ